MQAPGEARDVAEHGSAHRTLSGLRASCEANSRPPDVAFVEGVREEKPARGLHAPELQNIGAMSTSRAAPIWPTFASERRRPSDRGLSSRARDIGTIELGAVLFPVSFHAMPRGALDAI
jgi:hypothetical protein